MFHASAYSTDISQQCTTATGTHTEAVDCQGVIHPCLWSPKAPGYLGGG